MEIDWVALRAAAVEVMGHAYAPYSDFPVGVAGLVDDGRIVVGCNVENASYGVTLCAECGMVSALHASGGGRLVAVSCVDGAGQPLMPCGRCRQLLFEHGGPECLVEALPEPLRVGDLLPHAFGPANLDNGPGRDPRGARAAGPVARPGHGLRAHRQRRRRAGLDRLLGARRPARARRRASSKRRRPGPTRRGHRVGAGPARPASWSSTRPVTPGGPAKASRPLRSESGGKREFRRGRRHPDQARRWRCSPTPRSTGWSTPTPRAWSPTSRCRRSRWRSCCAA